MKRSLTGHYEPSAAGGDKWLCMWLRLVLLRELLSETGSLWMTLDDNEVHRARMVMDEIFGEDNFVATCIWHKRALLERLSKAYGDERAAVVGTGALDGPADDIVCDLVFDEAWRGTLERRCFNQADA